MEIVKKIDLSGIWSCKLDPDDIGLDEEWYKQSIEGAEVSLPGTTNEFGLGEKLDTTDLTDKEKVKRLRESYRYQGKVWYQKSVTLPHMLNGCYSKLFLERIMFSSQVWINEVYMGNQDSLSVPHIHLVPFVSEPGKSYTITVCIDNRDVQDIGQFSSGYTDETQSIWNGMIGRIEWQFQTAIAINNITCYSEARNNKLSIQINYLIHENGISDENKKMYLDVNLNKKQNNLHGLMNSHEATFKESLNWQFKINLSQQLTLESYELDINEEIDCWDEFHPNLYELTVKVMSAEGTIYDERCETIGFRDIDIEGTQFSINGNKTFLRGTLECCIFPRTGYPPTERNKWDKVFSVIKSSGMNHLRFHSWCPPEVAFDLADEYGIYLLVESPLWMDTWCEMTVGCKSSHYNYLPEEAERIINTYANHPSFCFYSNGNELNGDFTLLHNIIGTMKSDKRFLKTLTSNWDRNVDVNDDFFIAQTVDGVGIRGQYYPDDLAAGTIKNYSNAVKLREMPIVAHEVGQYCVYPNISEINKYDGCLVPVNLQWIRDDLKKKQMIELAEQFTITSGKLAFDLYKAEIEAALRTDGFGGIQLLDIHDFPGQSTATVGLLDSFWDSKGIVEASDLYSFYSSVVPLVEIEKFIWSNDENIEFSILIANYGACDMPDCEVLWKIIDKDNNSLFSGLFKQDCILQGQLNKIGLVESLDLCQISSEQQLKLEVSVPTTDIRNSWDIWIYPDNKNQEIIKSHLDNSNSEISIHTEYSEGMKNDLNAGKSVLYMPRSDAFSHSKSEKFYPVMWSPVHFSSDNSCGVIVNENHSIFRRFPTGDYSSFQWYRIIEKSFSINYDTLPRELKPITITVPNFFNNNRRTSLFEAYVGKGKLVFCGYDLLNPIQSKEQNQLLISVLEYMQSNDFEPNICLDMKDIEKLHAKDKEDHKKDLTGDNLALGRSAAADSEDSELHSAKKGNDGVNHTLWSAADDNSGHWWQVDLGKIKTIKGTKVKFENEANYLYVIQVSKDGLDWVTAVNQTGQTSVDQTRVDYFDCEARYIKIIYNGLPKGVRAAHYSFEVY